MGNLLSDPVEDIHGTTGEFSLNGKRRHTYSLSHMQGWRSTMEDAHICMTSLPENKELKFPEIKEIAFFGVFDGHGGSMSSMYCEEHFVPTMQTSAFYQDLIKHFADNLGTGDFEEKLVGIIKSLVQDTVCLVDNALRVIQEEKRVRNGTTAIFAFITEENIICCNMGDSRGLLCRANEDSTVGFEFLATKDHKPDDLKEKARIQAAGLNVVNNRICYDLALSRAFGDFAYKNVSNLSVFDQPVSIFCDIYVWPRDGEELFLCLACDGIWDIMSNGQVSDFVCASVREQHKLKEITDNITKKCLDSQDNMSVLIVAFEKLDISEEVQVEEKEDKEQVKESTDSLSSSV